MAMTMRERKAAQRARPLGYAKSRECDWRQQGISDASFVSFEAKLVIQNYHCPLCNSAVDTHSSLDHNHETCMARGVLCQECNLLLGKVEAGGSQFLANASEYLAAWSQ